MERIGRRRPRDIVVQAAVSGHEEERVFEVVEAAGSSHQQNADGKPPEPSDSGARIKQRIPVRTITLASLLRQFWPAGRSIDLLNVDCEREDLAILQSNDWERYRPGVIIVEDFEWVAEQSPIVNHFGV